MKHSTFYAHKGRTRVYTTVSHSAMHRHLRNAHSGRTYEHSDDAALFFIPGMPLDKPVGNHTKRITSEA